MPVMAQRRNSNLGEFAEDATVVTDDTKGKRPLFIEANTVEATLQHLRDDCIIPVFAKDNEATLSHVSFIETVQDAANTFFNGERIGQPDIRVSHVIKGRIPEAIHKPANQLLESDKTIYYERCAFVIEIPTIYETVNGNRLTLTVGGVRAYNHTNLYSKKGAERFKVFIGFICINRRLSYLFGSNQYQRIISCRIGNVQQVRPCQAHTSDADTWRLISD